MANNNTEGTAGGQQHDDPRGSTTTAANNDDEQQQGGGRQQQQQLLSAWLDLTQQATRQLDPKSSVIVDNFWKRGIRSDGRLFSQVRPYNIQHGILNTSAIGSALVQCRSNSKSSSTTSTATTVVLAAVTLQVGQPAVAAPKQGDVVVSVSSPSSAAVTNTASSVGTEAGGGGASVFTGTNLPRLESFLQRVAEENIGLEQLCIEEGKIAYRLNMAISILDASGGSYSLVDVCIAAMTAALLDTQLPSTNPTIVDGFVVALYDNNAPPSNKEDNRSISNDDDDDDDDQKVCDPAETIANKKWKRLQMPIIPCSLTALSVRLGIIRPNPDIDDNEDKDKDGNNTTKKRQQQQYWIVDPDGDEAMAVPDESSSLLMTVVVNAADETILAVDTTTVAVPSSHATAQLHHVATTTPAVATTDVARLMNMALGHAKGLAPILTAKVATTSTTK